MPYFDFAMTADPEQVVFSLCRSLFSGEKLGSKNRLNHTEQILYASSVC